MKSITSLELKSVMVLPPHGLASYTKVSWPPPPVTVSPPRPTWKVSSPVPPIRWLALLSEKKVSPSLLPVTVCDEVPVRVTLVMPSARVTLAALVVMAVLAGAPVDGGWSTRAAVAPVGSAPDANARI